MYDEAEYIYQQFQDNFADIKNRPIILYGIGNNTGKLLSKITEYNIVGLMDGKRKDGYIWGKRILGYKEVEKTDAKVIVIIARPAVIGVIYHRISEFCKKNQIIVYDINGRDLSKVYVNQENDIPYFHISYEDLEREIEKFDTISFDIFDTLIMRKTLYPRDVFHIIERKIGKQKQISFASLRILAEEELYRKGMNPNIYEIYERIQELSGISTQQRQEYLNLEISTEMEILVPRKKMLELFNSIKKRKKIYLISDMYLTKEILANILETCGYKDYEDIYVSCERRCSKAEGLFDIYSKDIKDTKHCLHIGDNRIADIMSAQRAGIAAFQVMSGQELLESSSYKQLLISESGLIDHLAIGLFCEQVFNNPFALYNTNGKPIVEDIEQFAYLYIAPVIFYFTIWLIQKIQQLKCDYILYTARDSYLIQKIFQLIKEHQCIGNLPDGVYFYTSRRAILAATTWNENDIRHRMHIEFWGDIKDLFKKRFDIEIEEQGHDVRSMTESQIEFFVKKYEKRVLEQCKQERKNYISYISKTGLNSHRKIALIDFIAVGKVQNGLEKLIPEKKIQGFYFLKRQANKGDLDRDIQVESFYPSKGDFEIDSNIYHYYLFLELILTSPEATFHSVCNDGRIRFMKETRSKEHRRIVRHLQQSVINYANEFTRLYPKLEKEMVDRKIPDIILGFLGKEYTDLNMKEITSLSLSDEFYNQSFNILG